MGSRDEAAGWPGRCHRVPGRPGRLARHAARVLPTRRLPPPGGSHPPAPTALRPHSRGGGAERRASGRTLGIALCAVRGGRAGRSSSRRHRARRCRWPRPTPGPTARRPPTPPASTPTPKRVEPRAFPPSPCHWLAFPATRPLPAVLAKGSRYLADHQRARRGVASGPGTPSCCRKCEPGLRPQDALGLSCVSWPAPARQNRKSLLNSSAERFSSRLTSADTVQNMVGSTRVSSNRGRINKTRCVPTVGR